jgi:DMSO/TMAO reductase YedYZ molybdopterin-dependent catalytic subunit
MTTRNVGIGALVGGLLTAALTGLSYFAYRLVALPFAPFELFDWMGRVLPGPVITFGIDRMIDTLLLLGVSVADTAKSAEQTIALGQFLVGGIVLGAVYFAVMSARKIRPDLLNGLVAGALFGLPLVAISIAIGPSPVTPVLRIGWLLIIFLGWGAALSLACSRLLPAEEEAPAADAEEALSVEQVSRRRFLIQFGTATAAITVVGAGAGVLLDQAQQRRLQTALSETEAHNAEGASGKIFPNADDPVSPAPGTRPEYTPLKDFYKVFIRTEPTVIDGSMWMLPITGLVDNPLVLTLDDLQQNYQSRDQYVTLSCISGRIGTTLISTTQWTGVSVQDILADAQVHPEARYLHITSGDGFYETVDLELVNSDERIMLCYAWDGNPLPVDHGFPLRIWIPDRYGMKQPKWITGIEVSAEYTDGYWVERSWDKVAQVKATSVIDTVAADALIEDGDQTLVPIGGIAFAGARGISQVQVRVDGGPWEDALLRSPLSETTWVIWRYDWPFAAGDHTFEVRCAEGDGTPQIEEAHDARPDGATGIHSVEATI